MKQKLFSRTCHALGTRGVFALMISHISFNGCNTWKIAGNDIERTGEAMQGDD